MAARGKCATTAWSVVMAIITRVLFIFLSIVIVWRVTDVKGNPLYWLLLLALLFLLVEMFYTVTKRKGAEFKWFAPSYFSFLACTVPGIWIMELDRWDRYEQKRNDMNVTATAQQLSNIYGITIPVALDPDTWIQALEQILMLLLVLARWLLPKGKITRERLSQILLVFVGLASDIIELFDLFELDSVMTDWTVFRLILIVWTLSLTQFTLVLAKSRGLFLAMILQDIPFLAIRLHIIVKFNFIKNSLLFFTSKNILLIALQIYRIIRNIACRLS